VPALIDGIRSSAAQNLHAIEMHTLLTGRSFHLFIAEEQLNSDRSAFNCCRSSFYKQNFSETVTASVFQRSSLLLAKRSLRQKAPRDDKWFLMEK
jgi:hypothetical protein